LLDLLHEWSARFARATPRPTRAGARVPADDGDPQVRP
jgi:hypothetical protein